MVEIRDNPQIDPQSGRGIGARSRKIFGALCRRAAVALDRGMPEKAAIYASGAARVASFAHMGQFSDFRLEELLVRLAASVPVQSPAEKMVRPSVGPRRLLHVATRLLATGGHTRLLQSWIVNDRGSRHDLAVTSGKPVPPFIQETMDECGGSILYPPVGDGQLQTASWLRGIAQAADLVLLHVHQFDPVPTLAFASSSVPPVLLINHSDHTFWIGTSVVDAVVNIRPFADELTRSRRAPRSSLLIPVPLRPAVQVISRSTARARLGLRDSETMLIAMSAAYKFTRTERYDFFRTAAAILEESPSARLFVLGVTIDQGRTMVPSSAVTERIDFLGPVADPRPYLAAADIYLDSFPYPSMTSVFESVASGVFPVFIYAPTPQLDFTHEPAFRAVARRTETENEYRQYVSNMITNVEQRQALAARAAQDVRHFHTGVGWLSRAESIYDQFVNIKHVWRVAGETLPRRDDIDVQRAMWDESVMGRYPVACLAAPSMTRLTDVFRLASDSLRLGDTAFYADHLRAWGSVIRQRFSEEVNE